LTKNAALLESTETFQMTGSKCKEITNIFLEDKIGLWPFKKTKEQLRKYYGDAIVKIEGDNPCKRCVYARQTRLPNIQLKMSIDIFLFFLSLIIFFLIVLCLHMLDVSLLSSGIFLTLTLFL